ncbi:unnamed protein product, partial [Musa hybrid cultivar]
MGGGANMGSNGLRLGAQSSLLSSLSSQYGGPGSGLSSYGGFSGSALPGAIGVRHHHNLGSSLPSSMGPGNPGLLVVRFLHRLVVLQLEDVVEAWVVPLNLLHSLVALA